VPKIEKVTFQHQTNEMIVAIQLVNIDIPNIDKIVANKVDEEDKGEDSESEEECDLIFKVKLEKPEPAGVKISKRNICIVTISKGDHH
jgi:phosphopantothenoylcysteine synthetase/decarboxylase